MTAALSRRVAGLSTLAKLAAKARDDYGDACCGGPRDARHDVENQTFAGLVTTWPESQRSAPQPATLAASGFPDSARGPRLAAVLDQASTLADIAQVRLGTSPISAIPEPAAWGMMILGFFGLGAILRSRRRAKARLGLA
jgi:hypothetical protein